MKDLQARRYMATIWISHDFGVISEIAENISVWSYLGKLFPKILRSLFGYQIIEYNIQVNHVHMGMIISPKYEVLEVVSRIKDQDASKLRKIFLVI